MLTALHSVVDRAKIAMSISWAAHDDARLILWTSPKLAALLGTDHPSAAQERELFVSTDQETLERIYRSHSTQSTSCVLRAIRPDGSRFWNKVTIKRVHIGASRYWITTHEDTSVHIMARADRERLVASAHAHTTGLQRILQVSDVIHPDTTLSHAVAAVPPLLVPAMAQWAVVALVHDNGEQWLRWEAVHESGRFSDAFDRDVTVLMPSQARQSGFYSVLRAQEPYILVPEVTESYLASTLPVASARALWDLGLSSLLIVPLLAHGKVIGLIIAGRDRQRPRFSTHDVEIARLIGQSAGNGLQQVRDNETLRHHSARMQDALLPHLPAVPGIDVESVYRPSAIHAFVGGDWYDMFRRGRDQLVFAVGDVCGHNADSAVSMVAYRTTIRTYIWQGSDPGPALDDVDELIAHGHREMKLATVCVALVDRSQPDGFRLTYTSAGHLPMAVLTPTGEVLILDDAQAVPLGVVPVVSPRPNQTITLPYGSVIIMITDGVVERRSRALKAGIKAFHETLTRLPIRPELTVVRDRLVALNDPRHLEDDMCFVVARIAPLPGKEASAELVESAHA